MVRYGGTWALDLFGAGLSPWFLLEFVCYVYRTGHTDSPQNNIYIHSKNQQLTT